MLGTWPVTSREFKHHLLMPGWKESGTSESDIHAESQLLQNRSLGKTY